MKKKNRIRTAAVLLGLFLLLPPAEVRAAGSGSACACAKAECSSWIGAAKPAPVREDLPDSMIPDIKIPHIDLSDMDLPDLKIPSFRIPDLPSDFHLDKNTEKKRLEEAISRLDQYGLSPEKVVERFLEYISRRENRDRIGEKAEELKEKAGDLREGAGRLMEKDIAGSSDSGSAGTAAGGALPEEARREIDRVRKAAAEEAGRKIEEAVDAAADQAAQKAAEEIDRAAESVKKEVAGK